MDDSVLERLAAVINARKLAAADSSYVASLHQNGINKILEKVGEEATETILAAKDAAANQNDSAYNHEVVKETADLWFHTMVMLSHLDINIDQLMAELERRMGTSGLVEKAARNN